MEAETVGNGRKTGGGGIHRSQIRDGRAERSKACHRSGGGRSGIPRYETGQIREGDGIHPEGYRDHGDGAEGVHRRLCRGRDGQRAPCNRQEGHAGGGRLRLGSSDHDHRGFRSGGAGNRPGGSGGRDYPSRLRRQLQRVCGGYQLPCDHRKDTGSGKGPYRRAAGIPALY